MIGQGRYSQTLRDGIERRVPFEDKFFNPNFQTMRGFDIQLMPVQILISVLKWSGETYIFYGASAT